MYHSTPLCLADRWHKIQQERERRTSSKSSKRESEGLLQNPARERAKDFFKIQQDRKKAWRHEMLVIEEEEEEEERVRGGRRERERQEVMEECIYHHIK